MSDKLRIRPKSRDTWLRLPFEPEEAYQAFVSYRNQIPPRDIRRATIHNVVIPSGRVAAWSQAWGWVERTAAHDAHFDSIALNERERVTLHTARKVADRHGTLLHRAFELCLREIDKANSLSEGTQVTTLKPSELTRMIQQVVQLQRLILDQSTANVEINNKEKLDALSPEQLEEMDRVLKKLGIGT